MQCILYPNANPDRQKIQLNHGLCVLYRPWFNTSSCIFSNSFNFKNKSSWFWYMRNEIYLFEGEPNCRIVRKRFIRLDYFAINDLRKRILNPKGSNNLYKNIKFSGINGIGDDLRIFSCGIKVIIINGHKPLFYQKNVVHQLFKI